MRQSTLVSSRCKVRASLRAAPAPNRIGCPRTKPVFGTSYTTASNVWFTPQGGRSSEVYYPRLDTPSVRNLDFVVTDGQSFALRAQDESTSTRLVNPHREWRKDVKRAADFLVNFVSTDGPAAPYTPGERWENQSGYSPSSTATEIAGLVCAANIAQANGDTASGQLYLSTADSWRSQLEKWMVTTNGPFSKLPYYLRLTKDGKPTLIRIRRSATSSNICWL